MLDGLALAVTYIAADVLRCWTWMGTSWPQVVEGQGSTLEMHLVMMAALTPTWPFILWRVGWYRPVLPRRAAIARVLVATVILCLGIAAAALLYDRWLYPRIQIGFVGVMLPIVALMMRAAIRRREGAAER